MDGGATLILSLAGSSVIAAVVSGSWSRNNARKEQLRQQMLDVAGSFAGAAMEALARLRDFKPTKEKPMESEHRNEALFADLELRASRCESASAAIDQLRPLRGRVHLLFSDRTGPQGDLPGQAGNVIGHLRRMLEASSEFWNCCDGDPDRRRQFEVSTGAKYAAAREAAWEAIDRFCTTASNRMHSP